jgi:hypothetical protein
MSLSSESIIAIIAVIISLPPSLVIAWTVILRLRQPSSHGSVLPLSETTPQASTAMPSTWRRHITASSNFPRLIRVMDWRTVIPATMLLSERPQPERPVPTFTKMSRRVQGTVSLTLPPSAYIPNQYAPVANAIKQIVSPNLPLARSVQ